MRGMCFISTRAIRVNIALGSLSRSLISISLLLLPFQVTNSCSTLIVYIICTDLTPNTYQRLAQEIQTIFELNKQVDIIH